MLSADSEGSAETYGFKPARTSHVRKHSRRNLGELRPADQLYTRYDQCALSRNYER
jgi:hypothetical protein